MSGKGDKMKIIEIIKLIEKISKNPLVNHKLVKFISVMVFIVAFLREINTLLQNISEFLV